MEKCCEYSDTVKLLKECDAGSKMAVTSIDDVLDDVKDEKLKKILIESKDHHTKLGNELHEQLNRHCADGNDPCALGLDSNAPGLHILYHRRNKGIGITFAQPGLKVDI